MAQSRRESTANLRRDAAEIEPRETFQHTIGTELGAFNIAICVSHDYVYDTYDRFIQTSRQSMYDQKWLNVLTGWQ